MIRRIFGVSPEDLDYSMVEALKNRQEKESQFLDFKQEPQRRRQKLATSVASMANAGGGVIVIGISDGADNRAAEIHPFPLADMESRLQQVLHNFIVPLVRVDYHSIPTSTGASDGVIVLEVHASEMAPFAVKIGDGQFSFHVRSDQHTMPLSEPMIAHMYSQRMARSVELAERLEDLSNRTERWTSPDPLDNVRTVLTIVPIVRNTELFHPDRRTLDSFSKPGIGDSAKPDPIFHAFDALPPFARPGFKSIEFGKHSHRHSDWITEGWQEFHDDGSYVSVIPADRENIRSDFGEHARPMPVFREGRLVGKVLAAFAGYSFLAQQYGVSGEVAIDARIVWKIDRPVLLDDVEQTLEGHEGRGRHPLFERPQSQWSVVISQLTPWTGLLQTTKLILDDLFTAFGWPECDYLSANGEIRTSHVKVSRHRRVLQWATDNGVAEAPSPHR